MSLNKLERIKIIEHIAREILSNPEGPTEEEELANSIRKLIEVLIQKKVKGVIIMKDGGFQIKMGMLYNTISKKEMDEAIIALNEKGIDPNDLAWDQLFENVIAEDERLEDMWNYLRNTVQLQELKALFEWANNVGLRGELLWDEFIYRKVLSGNIKYNYLNFIRDVLDNLDR